MYQIIRLRCLEFRSLKRLTTKFQPKYLVFKQSYRFYTLSNVYNDSSKIKSAVTALKNLKPADKKDKKLVPKKSWKVRIKEELNHYYHGFRLLFLDVKISSKLTWRLLKGYTLTRREHKLLVRTVSDLFLLAPFMIFIVVPFLEFTLPIFLKLFPNMLPSTFQTASGEERKLQKKLKIKLEMAKFLRNTLNEMPVSGKRNSELAKEFTNFFEHLRKTGEIFKIDDLMKFCKLFQDDITLDSLPRPQLAALCRLLGISPVGTSSFLRFQLRLKLRRLAADDVMIQRDGIESLSLAELKAACRARGMPSFESAEILQTRLSQWLELSLKQQVPPSLLLLSQAFTLPDSIPAEEKLVATLQSIPEVVEAATKASICEREGTADFKTKCQFIENEVNMIKKETDEQECVGNQGIHKPLETALDNLSKTSITEKIANEDITNKDLQTLECALHTFGKEKQHLLEHNELQKINEFLLKYKEDAKELQKEDSEVKETLAAKRLFCKINEMTKKLEKILSKKETKATCKDLPLEELISAAKKTHGVEDSCVDKISTVLGRMDANKDGIIEVDNLLKLLEIVKNERVKLNRKQLDELVELIEKEQAVDMKEKVIKVLKKGNSKVGGEINESKNCKPGEDGKGSNTS